MEFLNPNKKHNLIYMYTHTYIYIHTWLTKTAGIAK